MINIDTRLGEIETLYQVVGNSFVLNTITCGH